MATTMLPIDASAGSPAYTAQATRQALSALAGPAPAGRPLGARSGVRLGTPTTTATMSGAGSTTWNVAAHSGVLDTQTAAAAGPYFYATDGSDTGTITAADASNPRIDILYVKVNDTVQDGSGLRSGQVLYLAGTAAASPVAPATPARGMAIAQISVPKSGTGNPTVSWTAPTFYPDSTFTQSGTVSASATNLAGLGSTTVAVTFPVPFSVAPPSVNAVIVNIGTGSTYIFVHWIDTITTTGMSIHLRNTNTTTQQTFSGMSIQWTATGAP